MVAACRPHPDQALSTIYPRLEARPPTRSSNFYLSGSRVRWLFPERNHCPANLECEAVARRQKMRALVADSQRSSSDPLFQKASAATDSQRRRSRNSPQGKGLEAAAGLGSTSDCLGGSAERGFRHAQPNQYRRQLQSGNPSGNRQAIAPLSAGKPSTTGKPQKVGCSARCVGRAVASNRFRSGTWVQKKARTQVEEIVRGFRGDKGWITPR